MDYAYVSAVLKCFQSGVLCGAVGAVLGCASANPESGASAIRRADPAAANSHEMVDCLLPGQIRRLDETVTYPTEQRPIRTTKADCTGRGGTIQPSEGPTGSPSEPAK